MKNKKEKMMMKRRQMKKMSQNKKMPMKDTDMMIGMKGVGKEMMMGSKGFSPRGY